MVLIFAFKRNHVFKTFLDHVHKHWVLKTTFKVDFLHKISTFLSFKIFHCFDQSKISLDWSKMFRFWSKNSLPDLIDVWSMLDRSKISRFVFDSYLIDRIFFGSYDLDKSILSCIIYDRIHMHSIVFFIHLAFL